MNGQAMPLCSICWETLGKYGGPVTLPCGASSLKLATVLYHTVSPLSARLATLTALATSGMSAAMLGVPRLEHSCSHAGHNGCLHCMAQLQRSKPECPLCRAAFPAGASPAPPCDNSSASFVREELFVVQLTKLVKTILPPPVALPQLLQQKFATRSASCLLWRLTGPLHGTVTAMRSSLMSPRLWQACFCTLLAFSRPV